MNPISYSMYNIFAQHDRDMGNRHNDIVIRGQPDTIVWYNKGLQSFRFLLGYRHFNTEVIKL